MHSSHDRLTHSFHHVGLSFSCFAFFLSIHRADFSFIGRYTSLFLIHRLACDDKRTYSKSGRRCPESSLKWRKPCLIPYISLHSLNKVSGSGLIDAPAAMMEGCVSEDIRHTTLLGTASPCQLCLQEPRFQEHSYPKHAFRLPVLVTCHHIDVQYMCQRERILNENHVGLIGPRVPDR